MATRKSVTKYRPVLPAHLITHILNLAKQDIANGATNGNSLELISILAPFQAKVDNLGITPAYTTSPKQSVEELLGMEAPTPTVYTLDDRKFLIKEDYWKACYQKLINSGAQGLTLREIQAADEYRYLHDLMSPEEMVEFEKAAFASTPTPSK